jgi:hypothetical protein
MKAIKGKDALMEVYENNEYLPFLCCEDVGINIIPELINKTTVSSGKWNKYKVRRMDWDLSLGGISTILGSGRTIFETVHPDRIFQEWPIRITFTDAQGNTAIFTGNVVLKSASITGPQEDFSDFENAFQGSGPYQIAIDDSNPESGGVIPGGGGIGQMIVGSTFIIA